MEKNIDHYFRFIMSRLLNGKPDNPFSIYRCEELFNFESEDDRETARNLGHAFLNVLSKGPGNLSAPACNYLENMRNSAEWGHVADFYLKGIGRVYEEINERCRSDSNFAERIIKLYHCLKESENTVDNEETRELVWALFFPEAAGIVADKEKMTAGLREKRVVTVRERNRNPVTDPAAQILFTSNVLLTVPKTREQTKNSGLSYDLSEKLREIEKEEQIYWYDHPIQMGVKEENNEFLYGLKGLQKAYLYEMSRGNVEKGRRLKCLLSVSVTHNGLHDVARPYLEAVLKDDGILKNLDVLVMTENDTEDIVNEIISPAAEKYFKSEGDEVKAIFGVDGEYGRHYSFLKAVSALWSVMIDNDIRATFKVDLDQIFPQEQLNRETGCSAFEHFKTDLWGASGVDSGGRPVELGMIAGALVNEKDISKGLFTPDVVFPDKKIDPDEYIFFSQLPQAMSTEAEMMSRYDGAGIDGNRKCIERFHVTGGTTGILIESLRKHRPFTPSFIGRAEDQAYIMSSLPGDGERLAYLHKAGLFMRHDKESFAQEALKSAQTGKLIGDYLRILYFSAYARLLSKDVNELKKYLDPFTGCFISKIPVTVVYLRFALKVAGLFSEGSFNEGLEFVRTGAQRISKALERTCDGNSLKEQYEKERLGWNLYYDVLAAIEHGIASENEFAMDLKQRAGKIFNRCMIRM